MMVFEPPCTERYARWCERSTAQIMSSLLLDLSDIELVLESILQNFGEVQLFGNRRII